MASSSKIIYFCDNCGYESSKWLGQCPMCHEWNTFVEQKVSKKTSSTTKKIVETNKPISINEIVNTNETRIKTGYDEFDRVLGGGIVTGSIGLLGGDPGIGKSTILLQICKTIAESLNVLYVSGEESPKQIKLRALRVGEFSDRLKVLGETNLEAIESIIDKTKPDLVIIDSIQTMFSENIDSAPGNTSQIREATNILMQIAKKLNISIIIVGHVTKGGDVAGPRILEHMVDYVLYLEGDRHASYRILRGVKNRFGSTNEIGVFEMQNIGMVEVKNPSEYMLSGKPINSPGSVVTCSMEGTRPILVEIQGLVSNSYYAAPIRTATGIDRNRVNLLMAVLEKRANIPLSKFDGYVNVAGGIKVNEPAIDLAVIMAIVSSYRNEPIDDKLFVIGEVGLSGEVRSVTKSQTRIIEGYKLGFKKAIVPKACQKQIESIMDKISDMEITYISSIKDVL